MIGDLQGERIRLRLYCEPDRQQLLPLFQDPNSLALYLPGGWRLFQEDSLRGLLEDWQDGQQNWLFVIERRSDSVCLGMVNLDGLDLVQRAVEVGIALLPDFRRMGYAKEAMEVALEYLFESRQLHRVTAHIHAWNEASQGLFSALGFQREGAYRERIYRMGRYWDELCFGLLEQEYRAHTQRDDGRMEV